MHLVNTSTHKLHYFQRSELPDYAILSHRWDEEEVLFHDLQGDMTLVDHVAGFQKIKGCCAHAASEGWEYVWIDSCCIDKSSSAELSEAINSMFQWYRNAQVCYAYLSDVPGGDVDPESSESAFRSSVWFMRGWTLQELLAPSIVVFFNHDWVEIGTKSNLYDKIMSVTGIRHLANFENASVAQKMSWAAKRETTRVEDIAYCLMGLFDVNMPVLYGEGENAFRRLQLEILSKDDDESIFAWRDPSEYRDTGLLARSPTAFGTSGDIQRWSCGIERPPFSMTNQGLRIELALCHEPRHGLNTFVTPLNCKEQNSTLGLFLRLKKCADGLQFLRHPQELRSRESFPVELYQTQVVYVKQLTHVEQISERVAFGIETRSCAESGFSISQWCTFPFAETEWKPDGSKLWLRAQHSYRRDATYVAVLFTNENSDRFVLILQLQNRFRAGVNILIPIGNQSLQDISKSFAERHDDNELPLCMDRATKYLRWGMEVSVTLKKKVVSSVKLYAVSITVKSTGKPSMSTP